MRRWGSDGMACPRGCSAGVQGADAIEADAKEERLKYISGLLKEQSFSSYGKLGASVVPIVFEKVFRSNPISIRFVSGSIIASTFL
jgi:hypothetical protein